MSTASEELFDVVDTSNTHNENTSIQDLLLFFF